MDWGPRLLATGGSNPPAMKLIPLALGFNQSRGGNHLGVFYERGRDLPRISSLTQGRVGC